MINKLVSHINDDFCVDVQCRQLHEFRLLPIMNDLILLATHTCHLSSDYFFDRVGCYCQGLAKNIPLLFDF